MGTSIKYVRQILGFFALRLVRKFTQPPFTDLPYIVRFHNPPVIVYILYDGYPYVYTAIMVEVKALDDLTEYA